MQALNRHVLGAEYRARHDEELVIAINHVAFCMTLIKMQLRRGKDLIFEHPAGADSWSTPAMKRQLSMDGVD